MAGPCVLLKATHVKNQRDKEKEFHEWFKIVKLISYQIN